MDVSIVIATYNRRDLLEKSLECLFHQDYPSEKYEIVVIDDGSTDGSEEMVREKKPPCRLRYFRYQDRKGPTRARNIGISKAKGKVIIFIDSDILAPSQFIKEHMKFYKKDKNIIVDGPAINTRKVEGMFNSRWGRLLASLDFFGASFITANTSCLRENLIKAGLFDEEFGKGYGWFDRDMGLRLKEMGIRRIKNRRAYAFHIKRGGAVNNFNELFEKARDRGRNAALYYKKHPSRRVKREIKFRYLFYDKLIFFKSWLEKNLKKNLSSATNKSSLFLNLMTKLYLMHIYADELREALKKFGIYGLRGEKND